MTENKAPVTTGKDPDTGHDYDGIREFDNRLPNWWLAILYLTIFFSIGYWLYYHTLEIGPSSMEQYAQEMADFEALMAAKAAARGEVTDESIAALSKDAKVLQEAKGIFDQYCVACHGPDGGGTIGPNLTDNYWLNGKGTPLDIRKVIASGVPAKGMASWEPVLGPEKVDALAAFVYSLKGTNVPGGKEPQGELASN